MFIIVGVNFWKHQFLRVEPLSHLHNRLTFGLWSGASLG